MSADDEVRLAAIRERAKAQARAYAQMLVYDEGVGGLGVRHPEMFEDMISWGDSTENEHADTVLWLLDRLRAAEARAVVCEHQNGPYLRMMEQRDAAEARAAEAEAVIAEASEVLGNDQRLDLFGRAQTAANILNRAG